MRALDKWRKKRAERVAAVEKIEGMRKPEDFFGHRNRGKKMSKKAVDESPDVKCPYYKHENKWEIHCEGVQDGQCFHVAFGQIERRKDYERRLCKSKWTECLIAKGQNMRWDFECRGGWQPPVGEDGTDSPAPMRKRRNVPLAGDR